MISHITPDQRDITYDHRAGQAGLPVTVHYRDGRTESTILVMVPGQVEVFAIQLEQAIAKRKAAREAAVGWIGM